MRHEQTAKCHRLAAQRRWQQLTAEVSATTERKFTAYQHNRYCRTLIFNPYFVLMSDTFVGIK